MTTTTVNPLPALDDATLAALRSSIEKFGIRVPVIKDQNGKLLDGHHRTRIAAELGIPAPEFQVYTVGMEPEEIAELVASINDDRRQRLDPLTRRLMVGNLREEGHSQRAIAAAVDVSQSTVRDDLKELSTTTQLKEPEKIKGLDGKTRSTKKRPVEPVAEPEPEETPGPVDPSRLRWAIKEARDVLTTAVGAGFPRVKREALETIVLDAERRCAEQAAEVEGAAEEEELAA